MESKVVWGAGWFCVGLQVCCLIISVGRGFDPRSKLLFAPSRLISGLPTFIDIGYVGSATLGAKRMERHAKTQSIDLALK